MTKTLTLTLAAALTALASATAQTTPATAGDTLLLTVDDCLQVALSENPTVKVSDMEITRADYSRRETLAQLFPEVTFNAGYSRTLSKQTMYMNTGEGTVGIKMGRDNTHNAGFSATMPLVAAQLWRSIKLSDNQIMQNIEAARASRLSLVNQVKNAYYSLMLAYDSRDVIRENYATARVNADIYDKQYRMGTASEFDVLRSKVAMQNIEPSLLEADNSIRSLSLQLKVLMGMDVATPIKPATKLAAHEKTMYDDVMTLSQSLDNNTDLRSLQLQTDYLKQSLSVQKAAWLPTLALNIGYNWYSMSDGSPFKGFNWSGNSSVGLTLSWTLFNGGGRYYKQRQAELAYKEMTWQRDNLERSLQMQQQIQLDNIQKNVRQISTCAASVEQARKANEIQEKSFRIGASSYLDLRDSEDALMQSRLSYYQSIYNFLTARSDLELLLGTAQVDAPADKDQARTRTDALLTQLKARQQDTTATKQ